MKFSFLLLLLLIVFFLTVAGCKRSHIQSNDLPEATQTGRGIFACKVNGATWISQGGIFNIFAIIKKDSLICGGKLMFKDEHIERIGFRLDGGFYTNIQSYLLNDTATHYGTYSRSNVKDCFRDIPSGYGDIIVKKIPNGSIQFTKVDTVNKILSGRFAFDVSTDYCGVLKVTEGRFDVTYEN